MQKNLIVFFILSIFFSKVILSQEVNFYGEPKAGGIVVGVGKNIAEVWLDNKKLQIDKSGAFIFGFDRNAKGLHILKVKFRNNRILEYKYQIEKRNYEEQKLTVANKYVNPPARELKRINREAKKIKLARSKIGKLKTALFMSGFVYPVDRINITGVFGSQRILNGIPKNIHNGVDFAAEEGDSVFAITDGIVRLAANDFYFNGNFILLDHGQGLSSVYLHLSKLFVVNEQKVKKGQLIGLVGSTGRSTAPHLHLGVQWYNKRIDPMSLFELNL